MLLKNKRSEKVLSMWWFFCLAFVATGIVLAVIIFYSYELNINTEEAKILSTNILDCLSDKGYLSISDLNNFDIYTQCNLKKEIMNETSFFKILLYGLENGNDVLLNDETSIAKQENRKYSGGIIGDIATCDLQLKAASGEDKLNFKYTIGCAKKRGYLIYKKVEVDSATGKDVVREIPAYAEVYVGVRNNGEKIAL